jgi:hypothetical protein
MRLREAGRARDLFIDARVVLHRARAQRIKTGVDGEVQFREPGEVADDVHFRHLHFVLDLVAAQCGGEDLLERLLRHVERGKLIAAAAFLRALEDQRHQGRLLRLRRHFDLFSDGHRRSRETAALSAAAY